MSYVVALLNSFFERYCMVIHEYYVYILTNKTNSVLYIGVTNSLSNRLAQHKEGSATHFTARYNTHKLVYFEPFSGIENAISREKQPKRWTREKKNLLIETNNPNWEDLGGHFPL